MEKIQQAIERARQQRSAVVDDVVRSSAMPAKGDRASTMLDPDRVRRIKLDPDHLRRSRIVAAALDDPFADIFRTLRTQVLLRLDVLDGRSVAIVSARDGEGKTLVAVNLAMSLARRAEGAVFLIDVDFRRPSLHRTLGLESTLGLADYIEGRNTLDEVAINIDGTNLYVLPQPKPMMHGSELIGSSRCRDLLRDLARKSGNGYVVVDCPPLLLTDEPLAVQTYVDSCMLVVEQGRTTRDQVKKAAELLDETKYLGCVMNRAVADTNGAYYGYR